MQQQQPQPQTHPQQPQQQQQVQQVQVQSTLDQSIQALAQNKKNNLTPVLKEYAKQYATFAQNMQNNNSMDLTANNMNMQNIQNQMNSLNINMNGNKFNNYKDYNKKSNQREGGGPSSNDLDNTNLYIKGLWKDCTQVELDDIFKQFGVIQQSRVYGDGVGFVRFEQGFEAKNAIQGMDGAKLERCPDKLLVKYAFRKVRKDKRYIRVGDEVKQYEVEMIMNKNQNNVYLRCLPRGFAEPQLIELCEPYGELTCTRLRESGVAFVRYRKAEDAQIAIRKLNGKRFDGHNECLLAKLANSDPFQPKIGFKSHGQYDNDDNDENDTMSTNTMTPSQDANHAFNGQQQQQQQQQNRHQPQQQQQPNMHH